MISTTIGAARARNMMMLAEELLLALLAQQFPLALVLVALVLLQCVCLLVAVEVDLVAHLAGLLQCNPLPHIILLRV